MRKDRYMLGRFHEDVGLKTGACFESRCVGRGCEAVCYFCTINGVLAGSRAYPVEIDLASGRWVSGTIYLSQAVLLALVHESQTYPAL